MDYLVDTSNLCRMADTADPFHSVATMAVLELHRRGEVLYVTSQNLIEFRNVATRPALVNGMGLSPVDAEAKASAIEATFPMLPDVPDIYPAWKDLVESLGIIGKQVHDARLVAVCHVHRVTHVLTFNTAHFLRFSGIGSGLVVVDPGNV